MSSSPLLSVIVITHNRENQIVECVRLLSGMSACGTGFELIVVLDNCTERSLERLEPFQAKLGTRIVLDPIQANNPAIDRNRGSNHAHGSVILFLDDVVKGASPDLLNAHLRSQETSDVVVGYVKPGLTPEPDWWQLAALIW